MIKARPGLRAVYKFNNERGTPNASTASIGWDDIELKDGEYLSEREPIEAWDDDGNPMIIEEGKLVQAHGIAGVQVDEDFIAQIIPADGWVVWHVHGTGDDAVWCQRLAAWGRTAEGRVVALTSDDDGSVEILKAESSHCIRHSSEGRPEDWIAVMKADQQRSAKRST